MDCDDNAAARILANAKTPPGPAGKLDLADAERDPLHFLLDLSARYGDILRYETAYGESYLISNPELAGQVFAQTNFTRGSLLKAVLGEGLLASEGKYWQRQRRMMQPDFHHQRIAGFAAMMTGATLQMLERWAARPAGEPLDVAAEMARLTLDVVIASLFGGDLHAEADTLREAISALMVDIGGLVCTEFGLPLKISPSRNAQFKQTLATIDLIVYGAIERRRSTGAESADLLGMLLRARDADGVALTDRQVRDEVVTLAFAGSETTAMMLGWTWYLLGKNADAETQLHAEVDGVLGSRNTEFADVPRLNFTRMVIEESMRIYPPVWVIFRRALAETELGGYRINAGAKVIVTPYALHRHPSHWPDPERFDPERFTAEASAARPRFAYLPFGSGRHVCMGNSFAMMEGTLIIATIAQRYRLRLLPGHVVTAEPLVTLRQRHGVLVTLEPR